MIGTYLELSTGHLTQETMRLLSAACSRLSLGAAEHGWPAMMIAPYAEGCFITVPFDAEPEQWDALPTDLMAVIDYANSLFMGAPNHKPVTVLRFDADGDTLDNLPTYDW